MAPTGVRALWDPSGLGISISGMSCLGGGGSNPSDGRHTQMALGSASAPIGLVMFVGLGAHLFYLGGCTAAPWASWGSVRGMISSSGVGDASCQ